MKYGATVLDIYDDGGSLLKELVPSLDQIPSFVKTASSNVDQQAANNNFALVLIEDGQVLKKYATAGKGHTWLSAVYFAQTHDRLPEEARRVAATNLRDACEAYEIPVIEEIDKYAYETSDGNVIDVTHVHPADDLAPIEKVETTYAIERSDGHKAFPLANAGSIAAADTYFDQNVGRFQPRERREYAVKVAQVNAAQAGFALCQPIRDYSGEGYGSQLRSAMTLRRVYLTNDGADDKVMEVFNKVANARYTKSPEDFAELLNEFDEASDLDRYWDHGIPDPWYSTFGMTKEAKGGIPAPSRTVLPDGDTLTEENLVNAARKNGALLKEYFGEKFALAFAANPVPVFDSLPKPQKNLMGRILGSLAAEG